MLTTKADTPRPSIVARARDAYVKQREDQEQKRQAEQAERFARLSEALVKEMDRLNIGRDEYTIEADAPTGYPVALFQMDKTPEVRIALDANGYQVAVGDGAYWFAGAQSLWAKLGEFFADSQA